jgi:hypothetical protein
MYHHAPPITTEPPAGIERIERRVTTLLVAKLSCAGSNEHLCRVRNISESGMMIETHKPLGFASWVSVELRSGERLEGTVAWAGTGRAGVQFVQRVDVDRILADAKLIASGERRDNGNAPRPPRFEVDCPARISINGRYIDVTVENVSQCGARLRLPRPTRQDEQMIVAIPGLPSRRAITRWVTEEQAGVSFNDVIPYHELAAWLEHQSPEQAI